MLQTALKSAATKYACIKMWFGIFQGNFCIFLGQNVAVCIGNWKLKVSQTRLKLHLTTAKKARELLKTVNKINPNQTGKKWMS